MELYQLRYFKTVAETEHFTRAAELLHISQPSLSKAISNLESELGTPLFERDKRAVYLNDYGRALLRRVNRILIEADEAAQEIRDMCGKGGGDVTIGSCAMFNAPTRIHRFTQSFFLDNPALSLHLYIMETEKIEELLLSRKLDLGYAVTMPQHPEIECIELFSYRLGVVVSRNHPLADRGTVSLRDLRDEPFLCNNTSPDLRDSVYELCRRAGFSPRIAFEGESAELIGQAVALGRWVAFISNDRHRWKQDSRTDPTNDQVRFLNLSDDFCVRTVYLFQLRNRFQSSAVQRFRDGLLDYVQ
ncbi:MAG: LysR family transcriptional regulator [Oscillospiraceae bacterium]|nr:LysR family transcriptional regulator [Oscillospiraceae bacterium]